MKPVGNLLLLGLGIALAICELALRLIGFSVPNYYISDDYTGSRLRPGAEFWYRDEGEAHVRINSEGLRDREHDKVKPAGTLRIAILGDSQAEAKQVPLEMTFWSHLERELASCDGLGNDKIEVLNFGISGFGTAQELLMLRHRVWKYDPDIVVLTVTTGNDVRNNSAVLEPGRRRPFFHLKNDDLVLDDSFRKPPVYQLLGQIYWDLYNRSRIIQFMTHVESIGFKTRVVAAADSSNRIAENGLDEEIYFEPSTEEWREAWDLTEKLIAKIHEEVVARKKRLVVVTLSVGAQVHPDARIQERYVEEKGIEDLFYPDRRLQAFGEQHGIEVVMLAPSLAKYARASGRFLHGFEKTGLGTGHWNAEGHKRAGELIASALCPAGTSGRHSLGKIPVVSRLGQSLRERDCLQHPAQMEGILDDGKVIANRDSRIGHG